MVSEYFLIQGKSLWVNKLKFYFYILLSFSGNFKNDKKNGIGIYIANNSSNHIVGSFKDNQMIGMSIVIKENESFDNGQICVMQNNKSTPCINENQKKNLKLHNEYKELKNFYEYNSENIRKIMTTSKKNK